MKKIKSLIKKLRSKPEDVRKVIFAVSLTVSMLILVFIWVSGITNSAAKKQKMKKEEDKTEETAKLFTVLKDNVKETFKNLVSSLKDLNIVIGEMKEDYDNELKKEVIELNPNE